MKNLALPPAPCRKSGRLIRGGKQYTVRIHDALDHPLFAMSSVSVIDDSDPPAGLRFGPARGRAIRFFFEGREVHAFEGESVACALFAAGFRSLRSSPRGSTARGMFCLMGSCQECVVRVDGRRTTACQETVREGMDVRDGTIQQAP